jgi:hypothetical protein
VIAEVPATIDDEFGFAALARDSAPEEVVLLGEMLEELLRRLNERDWDLGSVALQG